MDLPDSPVIAVIDAGDLADVAVIHARAFPASTITRFGDEAIRRYYHWQLTGPHDLVVPLGVRCDGHLVGFVFSGCFNGSMNGFLRHNRSFLVARLLRHPLGLRDPVIRRGVKDAVRVVRRFRPRREEMTASAPSAEQSFGVLSLAVLPDVEGHGYANALMDEIQRRAKLEGFRQLHLTVAPSNARAVAFYERRGWQRDVRSGEWQGRMILALDLGS